MWKVAGHDRAIAALISEHADGSLPHALLLVGPASVGKTRLAQELAKFLNCTGDSPPCQECRHCRQIDLESHPDVLVVAPLEGKDSISIQQVRELREAAALRPFQGRAKVYIVAGAEALTEGAADALLKTLEEPQPAVTMCLTAPVPEALPATIVSRCRIVSLTLVASAAIAHWLVDMGTAGSTAWQLASLAQGRPGWAIQAAADPKLATQREELIERLSELFDLDLGGRLDLAESLTAAKRDRGQIRAVIELLVILARDILLLSQGLSPTLATGEARARLTRQASRLPLDRIHAYMAGLRLAMDRIDRNVDPRLTLEALMAQLP